MEEAALGTFTGKGAIKAGFKKVVFDNVQKDANGIYTNVNVRFTQ